jgi:hypothetical protein
MEKWFFSLEHTVRGNSSIKLKTPEIEANWNTRRYLIYFFATNTIKNEDDLCTIWLYSVSVYLTDMRPLLGGEKLHNVLLCFTKVNDLLFI